MVVPAEIAVAAQAKVAVVAVAVNSYTLLALKAK
jgi:hypothetical protein